MALVTTLFTVVAMLGAIAGLLWMSAAFETRYLGSDAVGGPVAGHPARTPPPELLSD